VIFHAVLVPVFFGFDRKLLNLVRLALASC
jgi:hypothetical protein